MLTCQSARRRQDAVFRERGSAHRFLPAHAPPLPRVQRHFISHKSFRAAAKDTWSWSGVAAWAKKQVEIAVSTVPQCDNALDHCPCSAKMPFWPFGCGLRRNVCFLFHRMFDSRRSLGRFFGSHMFNMNPVDAPLRGMLLRPFEGRFKWHRLHKK
jgi:hypothetical protein